MTQNTKESFQIKIDIEASNAKAEEATVSQKTVVIPESSSQEITKTFIQNFQTNENFATSYGQQTSSVDNLKNVNTIILNQPEKQQTTISLQQTQLVTDQNMAIVQPYRLPIAIPQPVTQSVVSKKLTVLPQKIQNNDHCVNKLTETKNLTILADQKLCTDIQISNVPTSQIPLPVTDYTSIINESVTQKNGSFQACGQQITNKNLSHLNKVDFLKLNQNQSLQFQMMRLSQQELKLTPKSDIKSPLPTHTAQVTSNDTQNQKLLQLLQKGTDFGELSQFAKNEKNTVTQKSGQLTTQQNMSQLQYKQSQNQKNKMQNKLSQQGPQEVQINISDQKLSESNKGLTAERRQELIMSQALLKQHKDTQENQCNQLKHAQYDQNSLISKMVQNNSKEFQQPDQPANQLLTLQPSQITSQSNIQSVHQHTVQQLQASSFKQISSMLANQGYKIQNGQMVNQMHEQSNMQKDVQKIMNNYQQNIPQQTVERTTIQNVQNAQAKPESPTNGQMSDLENSQIAQAGGDNMVISENLQDRINQLRSTLKYQQSQIEGLTVSNVPEQTQPTQQNQSMESQIRRIISLYHLRQQNKQQIEEMKSNLLKQAPDISQLINGNEQPNGYQFQNPNASSGGSQPDENNRSYDQAQVNQGEQSKIKNTIQSIKNVQKSTSENQAHVFQAPADQEPLQQQQPTNMLDMLMNENFNKNQITNEQLIDQFKKYTHQQHKNNITENGEKASNIYGTQPTKASGDDQSMHVLYSKTNKQNENSEAKLKRDALAAQNIPQDPMISLMGGQSVKFDGFRQINNIVQDQYKMLMNKEGTDIKKDVTSSEIYMSCSQLQQWLQENWLIGSLIIKMIVQKQVEEFSQFKQGPDSEKVIKELDSQKVPIIPLMMNGMSGLGGNLFQQLQDIKQQQQPAPQQQEEQKIVKPIFIEQPAQQEQANHNQILAQLMNQQKESQQNEFGVAGSKMSLSQIPEVPRQISQQVDQSNVNIQSPMDNINQLLRQRQMLQKQTNENKPVQIQQNDHMSDELMKVIQQNIPQQLQQSQQPHIIAQPTFITPDQLRTKSQIMNLLQNYNSQNKNDEMTSLIQQMMQNKTTEIEQPENKLNQIEINQQQPGANAIMQGVKNGLGMKRNFEAFSNQNKIQMMQNKIKSEPESFTSNSIQLPGSGTFDKIISQKKIKDKMQLIQGSIIDRVCEKSGIDFYNQNENLSLSMQPQSKVQKLDSQTAVAGMIGSMPLQVSQLSQFHKQFDDGPTDLTELQKMAKCLDKSSPSRCNDDDSEVPNTQRNQSESQCDFGEGQTNQLTDKLSLTENGSGLQTNIQIKTRRSNRHLSYEEQILNSLKLVMKEDLIKIRDNILEGLKKYQNDVGKVIIEAQLPRKNHHNTKNDFRGSKYRGPSKNRKKWQVMKMINKETVRIGAVKTELDAARIYDFLAILTEGLIAKTNFNYNVEQIQIIMKEFYFKDGNSIGYQKLRA